jgi:hypothetical protein
MNAPIIVSAPTAAIKIQSMVRVGSAKLLRMFPNPELGRRVKTVRAT